MWANSVWGLFGLSASCVLTMLGLGPNSASQTPLLIGAALFFIASIAVLCWPLRDADQRMRAKGKLKHPLVWLAATLEPSHVIILGLVIATIGVVWQARGTPSKARVGTATNDSGGKSLVWIFSGMAGKSDANGFRVGDIQFWSAKNETGKPIRLVDAFIQSGIDGGKKRALVLNTLEHGLIPLNQANPIPANTENITLMAEFPELSEADFMKDWGNITFVIQDSDHTFQGKVDERTFKQIFDGYRPKAPSPRATAAVHLSDFGWGFERYPASDFVGMSMAENGQVVVHLFQAQGHNNTKDPIVKIRGSVRSDKTNQEIPILFNPGNANLLRADELNPIPVGAIISSIAYFSNDRKPIPLKQFLSDWVPFTFVMEYDGKSYRHSTPTEWPYSPLGKTS
jgi:hypothetical protein